MHGLSALYRSLSLLMFLFFLALPTAEAHHIVMHNGPFAGVLLALVVDPMQTETLYVGVFGKGIFKSTDGGFHWQERNQGLDNLQVLALAIDWKIPTTLYAGTDAGVFKSTDGGEHWQQKSRGIEARNVRAFAVHPQVPDTLYIGTDQGVFKSTDGGSHWQESNQGLSHLDVRSLVIHPLQPHILYAATFGGIFSTTNAGEMWNDSNAGLLAPQVRVLAIDPHNPQVLYAGTVGGGIFESLDGGRMWQEKNQGFSVLPAVLSLNIAPLHPPIVYAGTISGIFRFTNSAVPTWDFLENGVHLTITFVVVDPQYPHTLYAGSGGLLFKSIDGGEHWENIVQEVIHEGPNSSARMP